MNSAFNARFLSTFAADRSSGVYLDRGEPFFIRFGGQAGIAAGLAARFALLEALLLRAHDNRGAAKLAGKIASMDQQHPSARLPAHKRILLTAGGAVGRSSLESAAAMGAHGQHAGRRKLKLRDRREMLSQIPGRSRTAAARAARPPRSVQFPFCSQGRTWRRSLASRAGSATIPRRCALECPRRREVDDGRMVGR